ncbi:MAG: class I SAM-dependent methyltransferase [Cytophagaceae bacterium]|nr:class I SAM-dependent methyltransferase [Cytophagaceae bacterium]
MYKIPLELLQSPVSKKPLTLADEFTLKDEEGNVFKKNIEAGHWNFIPSRSPIYSEEQWNTFKKLIENFVISYEKHPEVNVSYDVRQDAFDFGDFCKYHGKVLDIGCGPHKIPSYIKYKRNNDAEYYGIDILSGEHPKELNFVQAMGEHLPFRDNSFDVTISGTSLLHYVDVKAGIKEALRVTKPSGYSCIWLGVKSKEAPKPKQSPDWYKKLETPEGAENPFHYKRYTEEDFEKIFKELNLIVAEKKAYPVDEWRKNVFFRIKK